MLMNNTTNNNNSSSVDPTNNIETIEHFISQQQEKLDTSDKSIRKLQNRNQDLQNKLQKSLDALHREQANKRTWFEAAHKTVVYVNGLCSQNKENAQTISGMQLQISNLTANLENNTIEYQNTLNECKQQLNDTSVSLNTAQTNLCNVNKEKSVLQRSFTEFREKLIVAEHDYSNIQNELSDKKQENKTIRSMIDMLRKERDQSDQHLVHIKTEKIERKEIQGKTVEQQKEQILNLRGQLSELRKHNAKVIRNLEKRYEQELNEAQKHYQQQIQDHKKEHRKLKRELNSLKKIQFVNNNHSNKNQPKKKKRSIIHCDSDSDLAEMDSDAYSSSSSMYSMKDLSSTKENTSTNTNANKKHNNTNHKPSNTIHNNINASSVSKKRRIRRQTHVNMTTPSLPSLSSSTSAATVVKKITKKHKTRGLINNKTKPAQKSKSKASKTKARPNLSFVVSDNDEVEYISNKKKKKLKNVGKKKKKTKNKNKNTRTEKHSTIVKSLESKRRKIKRKLISVPILTKNKKSKNNKRRKNVSKNVSNNNGTKKNNNSDPISVTNIDLANMRSNYDRNDSDNDKVNENRRHNEYNNDVYGKYGNNANMNDNMPRLEHGTQSSQKAVTAEKTAETEVKQRMDLDIDIGDDADEEIQNIYDINNNDTMERSVDSSLPLKRRRLLSKKTKTLDV